ncbi:MAG: hypothetical protein ACTSV7_09045 [Candidatus Baldrarchaeia archaeon]
MVDKEEFVKILAKMDAEICKLLGDFEGESEIIRTLREYEKKLVELVGAKEVIQKVAKELEELNYEPLTEPPVTYMM